MGGEEEITKSCFLRSDTETSPPLFYSFLCKLWKRGTVLFKLWTKLWREKKKQKQKEERFLPTSRPPFLTFFSLSFSLHGRVTPLFFYVQILAASESQSAELTTTTTVASPLVWSTRPDSETIQKVTKVTQDSECSGRNQSQTPVTIIWEQSQVTVQLGRLVLLRLWI